MQKSPDRRLMVRTKAPLYVALPFFLYGFAFGVGTNFAGEWYYPIRGIGILDILLVVHFLILLLMPYAVHCARNSSEVINGISSKANGVIYSVIVPALTLISSSVMLIAIFIALLVVEPVIALAAFGGFGLIYTFIIRLTRRQLLADSQRIARESSHVIKSLQEGLGGIRDVLIDGSQATYCQIYRNADLPLRRAQGNNLFISSSPRYGMEALGMMLIAALAYSLAQQTDVIAKAIPILGA
jgi:ABC-type multidrug transport system fused ATPase/permease subunit